MTKELDDFFKSKGINKQKEEFTQLQKEEIQSAVDSIIRPAFEGLASKFSSYANISAQVSAGKNTADSAKENIVLKVFKTMQAKFFYQVKFSIADNSIYVNGQFCIPSIYGECTKYVDTGLKVALTDLSEETLTDDIISEFIKAVDIK